MTRDVLVCAPRDTCRETLRLMTDRGVKHAPALEGGRLVGLVSERDLLKVLPATIGEVERALARHEAEPEVRQAMHRHPTFAYPDDRLADSAVVFRERRIGALPVVEKGRLVGILTSTDILSAFGGIFTETPGRTLCLLLPADRHKRHDPAALASRIGLEVVALLPDYRPDGSRILTLRVEGDDARVVHFQRLLSVAGYLLLESSEARSA